MGTKTTDIQKYYIQQDVEDCSIPKYILWHQLCNAAVLLVSDEHAIDC